MQENQTGSRQAAHEASCKVRGPSQRQHQGTSSNLEICSHKAMVHESTEALSAIDDDTALAGPHRHAKGATPSDGVSAFPVGGVLNLHGLSSWDCVMRLQ